MKKMLNLVPLPISAVMLSFATLGNALKSIPYVRKIFGIIAGILFVVIMLKIIVTRDNFKKDMSNPIVASVFVTFFMGIVVLATYVNPFAHTLAIIMWFGGLILHFVTALYVFIHFIVPTKRVIPSHYVTFVGIVVASVTSPMFQLQIIGFVIFIIGFICFLILTPFVFKNLFKEDYIPKTVNPTKVIVAAPLSLCLSGYISSASDVNITFSIFLALFSLLLTILGIYFIVSSFKKEFNPTYAAYTFPMVISGVAMKNLVAVTTELAFNNLIQLIARIEVIIAACIVLFVLILYIYDVMISAQKASKYELNPKNK